MFAALAQLLVVKEHSSAYSNFDMGICMIMLHAELLVAAPCRSCRHKYFFSSFDVSHDVVLDTDRQNIINMVGKVQYASLLGTAWVQIFINRTKISHALIRIRSVTLDCVV